MSDASSKPKIHAARPWGIPAGIVVTLVAVILTQPIAALLIWIGLGAAGWEMTRAEEWLATSSVATFVTILLFELLSAGVVALFVKWRHVTFWAATALRRIHWRDVGYAVAGFLAYLGLAMVVLTILPLLLPINADQEQAIGFDTSGGALTRLLAFLGLVILPPIVEELLFRGFLFGTLRKNKLNFVWSTIITSLLFGSLHLFGSATGGLLWIGLADTFLLSIVLCFVREKTGSIWASIMLHALKNGLVFVNLFIIGTA